MCDAASRFDGAAVAVVTSRCDGASRLGAAFQLGVGIGLVMRPDVMLCRGLMVCINLVRALDAECRLGVILLL